MSNLFIGRKEQIRWLEARVFTTHPESKYSCSLRGPNGIGKTYLKDYLVRRFEEKLAKEKVRHAFVIDLLMKNTGYYEFFLEIFQSAADKLTGDVLASPPIPNKYHMEDLQFLIGLIRKLRLPLDQEGRDIIRKAIPSFFELTSKLGYYFILIIDEFDNASTAFPEETDDGLIFNTLFKYSAKTGANPLTSVLLISRRRAGTIAHHMAFGSSFDDAYPADHTILTGFSGEEMETYYASFQDQPCGLLPESSKPVLEFFCGRHPGMLTQFRDHYLVFGDPSTPPDILSYYRKNGSGIRSAYAQMLRLLNLEQVDRVNHIPAISAYKQAFDILTAYDANLFSQIELLNDFGFLVDTTEEPSDEKHAGFEGKLLEPVRQDSGSPVEAIPFHYEPIAPFFLFYIRKNAPVLEKEEIGHLIDETEITLRLFLEIHLSRFFGDAWEQKVRNLNLPLAEDFWEDLRNKAIRYGAFDRGVKISFLDALSIYNLSTVVRTYWEQLQSDLPSYSLSKFRSQAARLNEFRNSCHHNTLKILGDSEKSQLREICGTMMKDLRAFLSSQKEE